MTRCTFTTSTASRRRSSIRLLAGRSVLAVSLAALLPLAPVGTLAAADGVTVLPIGMHADPKSAAPARQQALQLRMVSGARPGTIIIELANRGGSSLRVLRDDTPFDDAAGGDFLRIVPATKGAMLREGAPYIGPIYGRLPPDASRYLELAPGKSLRAEVDLALNYDIPADGDYRLIYSGEFRVIDTSPAQRRSGVRPGGASWSPNTGSLEMTLQATPQPALTRARPPAFDQCTAPQQSMLEAATASGEAITNESVQSLRQTPEASRSTSPRYTTWFGFYTAPNYDLVTRVFERMSTVLADEALTYRCQPDSCSSDNTVAYVQPFLREDINLCPLFFNEQRLDDDFRAGTVVHELSHLLRIGNTDDLAYGSTASAALARNTPIDALVNADNYTLFATNDRPALPMVGDGPAAPDVPDEPGGTIDPIPLAAGGRATNPNLAADTSNVFRVSGAASLELTSLSGDADLYVFDSATLDAESLVCSSIKPSSESTVDSCEIVGQGDRFAAVFGFTAASYQLDAVPFETGGGDGGGGGDIAPGAIELAMNESASGTLSQRQASVYTAIMPGNIVLSTREGDADLYVFRNATFAEDALVCRSILTTPTDSCELSGTGRVHIGVLGVDGNNVYELAIQPVGSQPPAPMTPPAPDPTSPTTPTPPPAEPPTPTPADDDPQGPVASGGDGGDSDGGGGGGDGGDGGGGGAFGFAALLSLFAGAALGRRRRVTVPGGPAGGL